jgi:hypothetical protein
MAYGCLGIRLTLVMCLMLDIKLKLYQNFIHMVSYNREGIFLVPTVTSICLYLAIDLLIHVESIHQEKFCIHN